MAHDLTCPECGSDMILSQGPGRMRRYRGESDYEIPSDLEFPICPDCGAQWLTASQNKRLSVALELQRAQRRSVSTIQLNYGRGQCGAVRLLRPQQGRDGDDRTRNDETGELWVAYAG